MANSGTTAPAFAEFCGRLQARHRFRKYRERSRQIQASAVTHLRAGKAQEQRVGRQSVQGVVRPRPRRKRSACR